MTQPPGLPPEGWYPNPDNHEQQRWWDGRAWTEHVAVGAPITPGYEPQPAQPQPPQPEPAAPPQPQSGGPTQSWAPIPAAPANPYAYQPQSGASGPATAPPASYPGGQPGPVGYGYPSAYGPPAARGVLPDGAVVVGWWWRVLARLIDGVLIWVPTVLIGLSQIRTIGRILSDYFDEVRAAADTGQPAPTLDLMNNGDYLRAATLLVLIYALVWVVYEAVLLKLCAATLGKLICGLRVRHWDRRGPLSYRAVGLRVLIYQAINAVPTVGPIFVLIDVLWPLWDGKKQALHDKAAGTAVVKRHDAVPLAQQQTYGGATGFGSYQSY